MAITPQSLRQRFREFADPETYDDDSINALIGLAGRLLNADRWSDLLDDGTYLFVAHHLVLAEQQLAQFQAGGQPGRVQGPLTSKSVDKVSATFDSTSVTLEGGAHWNMTVYGIRFRYLAQMVGAGGVQL